MEDKDVLRQIPIFQSLSDVQIAKLAKLTTLRLCRKDEVIFYEDEEGDFFFVILAGRVKVTLLGIPDRFTRGYGREVVLSTLDTGDFFGEMALVDNEPRSATAVALEDSELLCLHRNDFQASLSDWRGVVNALLRSLTARLRRANHQLATLAIVDGYGRAARAILDMARETGKRAKDGNIRIKALDAGKLAGNIGTTRETVTRMIADLKKEGLIQVKKDQVLVTPAFEKAFD
jgi:CRP/FNR family transcriptional regulator/CRP/FNR family cyclic AMP-dependent transcriptional regulator